MYKSLSQIFINYAWNVVVKYNSKHFWFMLYAQFRKHYCSEINSSRQNSEIDLLFIQAYENISALKVAQCVAVLLSPLFCGTAASEWNVERLNGPLLFYWRYISAKDHREQSRSTTIIDSLCMSSKMPTKTVIDMTGVIMFRVRRYIYIYNSMLYFCSNGRCGFLSWILMPR